MSAARVFYALGFLPCALLFAEQQRAIPEPLPAARYDKLLEDSPFAVATPTAPVEEPVKPWAEGLTLGPIAIRTKDGKDIPIVFVRRKGGDLTGNFTLEGFAPGPDGIELVKVDWSEDPLKTRAVVKKGTEFATLEPNQADFTAPPPPPQVQGARGAGSALKINNPAAAIRRTPTVPGAQAIPRPSVLPATNPAAVANERKRIRVIPSPPAGR